MSTEQASLCHDQEQERQGTQMEESVLLESLGKEYPNHKAGIIVLIGNPEGPEAEKVSCMKNHRTGSRHTRKNRQTGMSRTEACRARSFRAGVGRRET